MDDETAEIELLQQNLNKTRQLSKRMINVLDRFDVRLAKLERSILPLYTATQMLNRRKSNIDKTLAQIEYASNSKTDLAADEALILRGPQSGHIGVYKDTLERLNTSIAFNSSDLDLAAVAHLVETGTKKLTQLYTKVVAEGSSGASPSPGSETTMMSFPASLIPTLTPVVVFLRTLPLPSTHPSHPAAPAILSTLKQAQDGYADMRGNWTVKCLEGQGKQLLARAETVDPLTTGREFTEWVELMLGISGQEYKLLKELSPLSSPQDLASSFGILVASVLKLFNSILAQLLALIKKALHRYNFVALSAYDGLLSLQSHWTDLLSRRGLDHAEDKNEVKDGVSALRALCLRSFPEFLADLKMGATARGSDTSVKLMNFTVSTVKYIETIPRVQTAVESSLLALGDGNWKMGEGVQVGKGVKTEEADPSNIIDHFIHDVVITAINSLVTLSRTSRHPAFGSIFLLNNISYLHLHLSLQPNLIPPATVEVLKSNFRTAKAGYFDANFSPLMQAISEDPRDKSNRSAAKEKFTRFFDLLDEVIERHKLVVVLEDDAEARDAMRDEVVRVVVPSFQKFTQKQRDKEFSKNPQKYIKRTAETVEIELGNLFQRR